MLIEPDLEINSRLHAMRIKLLEATESGEQITNLFSTQNAIGKAIWILVIHIVSLLEFTTAKRPSLRA